MRRLVVVLGMVAAVAVTGCSDTDYGNPSPQDSNNAIKGSEEELCPEGLVEDSNNAINGSEEELRRVSRSPAR